MSTKRSSSILILVLSTAVLLDPRVLQGPQALKVQQVVVEQDQQEPRVLKDHKVVRVLQDSRDLKAQQDLLDPKE